MEGQLTVGQLITLINTLLVEGKIKTTDRVFIGDDEELNGAHEPYSAFELCVNNDDRIDEELIDRFNVGLIKDSQIKENETILLIS